MSPADSLQFLEQYSLAILPALVVAEQIGVPLPAVPALLAVGALAAQGRVSYPAGARRDRDRGPGRGLRLVRARPSPWRGRADETVSLLARAGLVRAARRERLHAAMAPGAC